LEEEQRNKDKTTIGAKTAATGRGTEAKTEEEKN